MWALFCVYLLTVVNILCILMVWGKQNTYQNAGVLMSNTTRIDDEALVNLTHIAKASGRTNVKMITFLVDWWIKTHCPECGERTIRTVRCKCKDSELL